MSLSRAYRDVAAGRVYDSSSSVSRRDAALLGLAYDDVLEGRLYDESTRSNPAEWKLAVTATAKKQLKEMRKSDPTNWEKVNAALEKMKSDITHPSLRAHPVLAQTCPHGKAIFSATANQSKGGYRIYYCIDPDVEKTYIILVVIPHPKIGTHSKVITKID